MGMKVLGRIYKSCMLDLCKTRLAKLYEYQVEVTAVNSKQQQIESPQQKIEFAYEPYICYLQIAFMAKNSGRYDVVFPIIRCAHLWFTR